jgi:hypothetical protein
MDVWWINDCMDGLMDERTLVSISPTLEETKLAISKFHIAKQN